MVAKTQQQHEENEGTSMYIPASEERVRVAREIIFVASWLIIATTVGLLIFFPGMFGISDIAIKPVYHGAMFLGVSIIFAVSFWFMFQGFIRSKESTAALYQSIEEMEERSENLNKRFEGINEKYGRLIDPSYRAEVSKPLPKMNEDESGQG